MTRSRTYRIGSGWILCVAAFLFACNTTSGVVLMVIDTETDTETAGSLTTDSGTGEQTEDRSLLGMTMTGIADWGTQFAFIDLMKQSREWYDWNASAETAYDLDENGWVRSLATGQTAGTVFLTVESAPVSFDKVIVSYDGEGTIEYDWGATKIDGESAPGRDVVQIGEGSHLLRITETNPDNYLKNIAIVPEALEPNHQNGELFNPVWLNKLKGLGTIRLSDWMNINDNLDAEWSDVPTLSSRLWIDGRMPYAAMIKLANQLHANPWFPIPFQATDDYVRHLAALLRDTLDSDLTAHIEYTQHPWKTATRQFAYTDAGGRARWGDVDDAYMQWHAMRTAVICDIFKTEVFAEAPNRVYCIQSVPLTSPALSEAALMCPYYTAETGAAPCYSHGIDAVSVSVFIYGCLNEEAFIEEMRAWFTEDDGGMQKGIEQLTDGRHLTSCETDAVHTAQKFEEIGTLATSYGLEMVAFEAGSHVTAAETAYQEDSEVIDFHIALNRNDGMYSVYQSLFNAWQHANGGLFIHYVDIAYPGKHGSFGALEYLTQETSPKWRALMEFKDTFRTGG